MDLVANQPPPLEGYNVFEADVVLREAFEREGPSWARADLFELGRLAGSAEAIAWGFDANRHLPTLRTHDRFGQRIDEVEFHPAWHRLVEVAVAHGMHGTPWRDPRPGTHVARAAAFHDLVAGRCRHGLSDLDDLCGDPSAARAAHLAARWEPLLTARNYDPGLRPPAGKAGALCGMAMTERQGGSDVRAT